MPTLLLADDHALVRAGLKLTLQLGTAVTAAFEAGDGQEAVAVAERERPDLAILDILMPRLNGLEACLRIKRAVPPCKIVILSMQADDDSVRRAFANGASAYVLKSANLEEISRAVDAVLNGETYVSGALSLAAPPGDASPLLSLTSRQREVLQLIAEGESTKEIAFRLNLSGKTVEAHRRQIMERLRIFDVASLVRFALRAGLITVP